jgi:exodeoxyribonuclease VII small subunit
MSDEKDMNYQQAIEELRTILQRLQGDLSDIDQLEIFMKRAEVLIKFCSAKIKDMETRLEDIIKEIEEN